MRLVQGNKQAMARFVAVATTTTELWSSFVSARIGGGLRQAPTKIGYDPTAPSPLTQSQQIHRPYTKYIDDSLKIQVPPTTLRSVQAIENDDQLHQDLGVLDTPVEAPALASSFVDDSTPIDITTAAPTTPVCKIGYYGDYGMKTPPVPAAEYLKEHTSANKNDAFEIFFDESTQTVVCNQDYDKESGDYSCVILVFDHCNVRCNGERSCYNARIENAPQQIGCEGYESCYGAHLSTSAAGNGVIECGGEGSCQSSYVGVHKGNELSPIASLDCHADRSCAWSKAYNVKEVFCSGTKACYGAELTGIHYSVVCQGGPHPDGYYFPTCGGENAFIEAHEDSREKGITVTCSGDFACVGYGHDAYDRREHPIYFDIDVGSSRNGELICEGSREGNHDGGTYVCRYIDIVQGCQNYVCHEPKGFDDTQDYRTCNHVFSIHKHELCYEGYKNSD